jgi:hypothetical protein
MPELRIAEIDPLLVPSVYRPRHSCGGGSEAR